MTHLARLRRLIFGIPSEEVTFARRGFQVPNPIVRQRLERIVETFVEGYHTALAEKPETVAARLGAVSVELRGFAFEGASMALALLDYLTPWRRNRVSRFLAGPAADHVYMVHVGIGWATARIPWARRNMERTLRPLDPLLRWLVVDGYGFHQGFFHAPCHVTDQTVPAGLSGYARNVFDQGLGRSLWFSQGTSVKGIEATVGAFAPERQSDLWSGVGLACAYAGGVDREALQAVQGVAGPCRAHVAQGVAFAAKARQRAGIPAPHTEIACEVLCGMSSDEAAAVSDAALKDLPADGSEPAYEQWRRRIQACYDGV